MKYQSTLSDPAAPLIQDFNNHVCIACGQAHIACCYQCIRFVPDVVPCPEKCGHWVCNEGLEEYKAERAGLTGEKDL